MKNTARDWYKDAVFYEVHVKAFKDANGDGIGDFAGLTESLDYIQELGVDCLWILPMYPSPLRDDGYDIADFYGIHPSYGTVEDFQKFLDAAREVGASGDENVFRKAVKRVASAPPQKAKKASRKSTK